MMKEGIDRLNLSIMPTCPLSTDALQGGQELGHTLGYQAVK